MSESVILVGMLAFVLGFGVGVLYMAVRLIGEAAKEVKKYLDH